MPLNVSINLPRDVEEKLRREIPDLDADVNEAYALDLFRRGRITHYELCRVLGLDRYETDALLRQRGIFEGSLTAADLEADRRTLDEVMGKAH